MDRGTERRGEEGRVQAGAQHTGLGELGESSEVSEVGTPEAGEGGGLVAFFITSAAEWRAGRNGARGKRGVQSGGTSSIQGRCDEDEGGGRAWGGSVKIQDVWGSKSQDLLMMDWIWG